MPSQTEFLPKGKDGMLPEESIVMSVDEFEAIRLIDYEGLSQNESSKSMGVARTTVQQIYSSARKKISISIVEGKRLLIHGGKFKLCDGSGPCCARSQCRKRRITQKQCHKKHA